MRRLVSSAAAACAAALVLAACASGSSAQNGSTPTAQEGEGSGALTPVSVGVIPIVDVAPIYLGVEQGFFEEEGLDVTLELAQGGAAIVPAVMSGQYQFGFSNTTSLILASEQGLGITILTAGAISTGEVGADFGGVVAMPDSGIATAADLAGKTVAVNTLKNIGDTTVRAVVDQAGADPDSVTFVEMGFPDMPAAVAGGQVDAAWIVEPHLTRAIQAGAQVVSWNFAESDPDLLVGVYFTSQQRVADDPEMVAAFTAAMRKSLDYGQSNPDAIRAVLDTYTEIDPAVKEAMSLPHWAPDAEAGAIQRLADLGARYGMFDSPPDTSKLLP
ncbi:ABC transporter substrate-binding protein [Xylanimonas ulmi]|uniref:NitT/TauT family transport system substrate-binding protein n=1 Tax=Xylanimonas ulmi TaxID=228973 RepID=A0A4Q7M1F1_9MICO|nr:ABC transporter substrate-binding protein [Xylanibacterium ulmi]RZS60208.1 NitT/TauT family transport system substrate-binding protein [Xylanibacterium ulmi]